MVTTILVDGNNLGISSHFAARNLTDPDGRPSGAIYGFIRSLRPILDRTQVATGEKAKVIVAWDATENWRTAEFPEYKSSRKKNRDPEMEAELERYADQVPRLRSILTTLGVSQIRAHGFEADDVAGWITRRPGAKWMLVSNDKDWLQLVGENCSVWQATKERYISLESWAETLPDIIGSSDRIFPTNTDEFVKMLAIAGDDGDDIPGQKGVGYSTALKVLQGKLVKGKKFDAVQEWMVDPIGYTRSLRLVDLRSIEIPPERLVITKGNYDATSFMNQCVALGFNSILGEIGSWMAPFAKAS